MAGFIIHDVTSLSRWISQLNTTKNVYMYTKVRFIWNSKVSSIAYFSIVILISGILSIAYFSVGLL